MNLDRDSKRHSADNEYLRYEAEGSFPARRKPSMKIILGRSFPINGAVVNGEKRRIPRVSSPLHARLSATTEAPRKSSLSAPRKELSPPPSSLLFHVLARLKGTTMPYSAEQYAPTNTFPIYIYISLSRREENLVIPITLFATGESVKKVQTKLFKKSKTRANLSLVSHGLK